MIATIGLAFLAGRDRDLAALRPLLNGHDATAIGAGAVDADHLRLVLADHLDDTAGIAPALAGNEFDAQKGAVADTGGCAARLLAAAG